MKTYGGIDLMQLWIMRDKYKIFNLLATTFIVKRHHITTSLVYMSVPIRSSSRVCKITNKHESLRFLSWPNLLKLFKISMKDLSYFLFLEWFAKSAEWKNNKHFRVWWFKLIFHLWSLLDFKKKHSNQSVWEIKTC